MIDPDTASNATGGGIRTPDHRFRKVTDLFQNSIKQGIKMIKIREEIYTNSKLKR